MFLHNLQMTFNGPNDTTDNYLTPQTLSNTSSYNKVKNQKVNANIKIKCTAVFFKKIYRIVKHKFHFSTRTVKIWKLYTNENSSNTKYNRFVFKTK